MVTLLLLMVACCRGLDKFLSWLFAGGYRENDMVFHTEKTGMIRLVVKIKYVGKIADVFDKATWSFDGLQPEQEEECSRTLCSLKIVPTSCSCDIALSSNLDDLTLTRLSRAGQSAKVDNIQGTVSDDDDFIVDRNEDEDVLVIDSDINGLESDNNQCEGDGIGSESWQRYRRPRYGGCQGSGGGKDERAKTKLVAFRKMWEDNRKKLLPINFDSNDGETWKPVGKYSHQFITMISFKIGDRHKIPFYFDSWAKVEDQFKTDAAFIGVFFRLLLCLCVCNVLCLAAAFSVSGCTNSNPDEYPSLVLDFGLNHTSKAMGTYVNEAAATKHKQLQDALKSSQESEVNVPEKEVVKKVLGTRSGHTRGMGRKLKGVLSSSSVTSSSSNYYGGSKTYTQDEVNDLFKTEGKKLCKSLGKKIAKKIYSSFNKKLENIMTRLAEKGMSFDKTPMVGEEDEEYEESDDEEMEVLDEDEEENENEKEDEEINGDDYVE
nr:hypothetical protein [Tanacetum cinerariifolium]